KNASSIIIEFTRPQDANKIIDEGLIWHGEVFQCELKDEMAKVKSAYAARPRYHLVPQSNMAISQASSTVRTQEEPIGRTIREGAPSLAPSRIQQNRQGRSRSPTKRGQKRANPGSNAASLNNVENEITVNTGSQRPQRVITPSRRALEALANSARLHGTYQADNMDVDNRE
ncbi:hypothetical protein EDB81DRAFT_615695, partial [Dactylonectria macrodidyma]